MWMDLAKVIRSAREPTVEGSGKPVKVVKSKPGMIVSHLSGSS